MRDVAQTRGSSHDPSTFAVADSTRDSAFQAGVKCAGLSEVFWAASFAKKQLHDAAAAAGELERTVACMTAAEAAAEEAIAGEAPAEAYAAVFARERTARNLRPRNEVREAVVLKR